jgi:DNA primase
MSEISFLDPETRRLIDENAADTADVAQRLGMTQFRQKRNSLVGDCPGCGAKDGLEIVNLGAKKGVFKCFHCETVKGRGGASLLQNAYQIEWKKAYSQLAEMFKVNIPEPGAQAFNNDYQGVKKVTFRDLQLKHSGIPDAAQKWMQKVGEGKWVEHNRYSTGTMNAEGKYIVTGDDMVLHYIGLDELPILFRPEKAQKEIPLIRVRYQHPDLHTDKEGNAIKYRSPRGSGSHLWLPKAIIEAWKKATAVETLYVVEGEKKADKMCLHGLPAVGIMGIHNLALDGTMPRAFEMLVTKCGVKNVVFVLDSDWQDISVKPGKAADQRPYTFYKAAIKFRDYFYGFRNSGIDLGIFLAAGKDQKLKGMDDLLAHLELAGHETLNKAGVLADDIGKSLIDAKGEGDYVTVHKIHPLRMSEYQLKQLWALETSHEFIKRHAEKLAAVVEFKIGKLLYFYDAPPDAKEGDKIDLDLFKLAQQILPEEQFWEDASYTTSTGRKVLDYRFDYDKIRAFLYNRGIGLHEYVTGLYRTVRKEGKFIEEISHTWIQRYVADFCDTLKDREVVKMILRGNTQYLGPNNLNYMYMHNPDWIVPNQEEQILIFRNCFWRIKADSIEQRPLSELPGSAWQNQVIPFDAEYLGEPMVKVGRDDKGWTMKESPKVEGCEMYKYLFATSMFFWQKFYELRRTPDGMQWIRTVDDKEMAALTTDEDRASLRMHIITKLIAWGYKLRDYRDRSNQRAIICMDGLESQVGKSEGGSGKSIYAQATRHCQPLFIVDGKTADLKNDRFLYHGVDERTREIVFDDVRVNFDFELLFSQITEFIRVKPFQGAPITIQSPTFTITTNHAIRGDSTSFRRRQYLLGFSNYFNEFRTPRHEFGHTMFEDWDKPQWNQYYNLMATAIQVYMQFPDLGRFGIDSGDITRRKLRQQIGEDFLEFADLYFTEGYMLNRVIVKERILEDYCAQFPNDRKFMDVRRVKEKCELYAKYVGLDYNAPAKGPDGRIKSSGFEFISITDQKFDANMGMADKVFVGTSIVKTETPWA